MRIRLFPFIYARAFCAVIPIFIALYADAEQSTTSELPVYAIEAQNGYRAMFALAGPKSAYLLGDASHGTEEYYAFRSEITKHLISKHGVRVIVLEEEWDSVDEINLYISGAAHSSLVTRDLLNQALSRWPRWLWNNLQMVGFIDWVKDWNRSHSSTEQVKMVGMDMKEAILPAIERLSIDVENSSAMNEELIKLADSWKIVLQQPAGGLHSPEKVFDAHSRIRLSLSKLLGMGASPARTLEMLDYANQYYQSYHSDFFKAWNIRSEYMAGFVQAEVAGLDAGSSLAVWAHNNHAGDKSADDVQGTGLVNMGQLLRERLGKDNLFILGSAGYQGEVRAAREWQNPGEVQPILPARDHSIEKILFQSQWGNPLLFWDTDSNRKKWSFAVLHRGIGAIFNHTENDADTWSVTNIADRYDALVFWKTTSALQL